MSNPLRGFCTVNYWAEDMSAARAWYTDLLGQEPYFVAEDPQSGVTGYLEWRVGDDQDELGIINRAWAPPGAASEPGGAVMHWHVDDLPATLARLQELGATIYQPLVERTQGFAHASVLDPFGNVLGLMFNPHYRDIVAARDDHSSV